MVPVNAIDVTAKVAIRFSCLKAETWRRLSYPCGR